MSTTPPREILESDTTPVRERQLEWARDVIEREGL